MRKHTFWHIQPALKQVRSDYINAEMSNPIFWTKKITMYLEFADLPIECFKVPYWSKHDILAVCSFVNGVIAPKGIHHFRIHLFNWLLYISQVSVHRDVTAGPASIDVTVPRIRRATRLLENAPLDVPQAGPEHPSVRLVRKQKAKRIAFGNKEHTKSRK